MRQPHFFPKGEDLPIFSGCGMRAVEKPFDPQPVTTQPSLLDIRLDPFKVLAHDSHPVPTDK